MKLSLILIFLLCSISASAQFNKTIRTGRPGQAIDPFAVGNKVFQTETGLDVSAFKFDDVMSSGRALAPNTFLRYGIGQRLDLNSGFEYRTDQFEKNNEEKSAHGVSAGNLGLRINFLDGSEHKPALGMQLSLKFPVNSDAYHTDYIAPKITLVVSQNLSEKIGLVANLGMDYNGNDPKSTAFYVLNLAYTISDHWGVFIENYASFTEDYFEDHWDAGMAYLVNNNLQLDFYGGLSKQDERLDYFASIGFSWRIHSQKSNNN